MKERAVFLFFFLFFFYFFSFLVHKFQICFMNLSGISFHSDFTILKPISFSAVFSVRYNGNRTRYHTSFGLSTEICRNPFFS